MENSHFPVLELTTSYNNQDSVVLVEEETYWIFACRRMNLDTYIVLHTKINSKWIEDLNVKTKTLFRGKLRHKSLWLLIRQWLLDATYNTKNTSNKRQNFLNWVSSTLETFVLQGGHHQESEKITQNGRKYLQIIYLIRDLYPECIKNMYMQQLKRQSHFKMSKGLK